MDLNFLFGVDQIHCNSALADTGGCPDLLWHNDQMRLSKPFLQLSRGGIITDKRHQVVGAHGYIQQFTKRRQYRLLDSSQLKHKTTIQLAYERRIGSLTVDGGPWQGIGMSTMV